MNLEQLIEIIEGMHLQMNDAVDLIQKSGEVAQKRIYEALLELVNDFEITDGRYVIGQNYARRFAIIQRKIESILGEVFTPSVNSYLRTYDTVDQTNIDIQKAYNDIDLTLKMLTPARQSVYKQAEYFLTDALADAYIQPAKFMLMQQVATGTTIKDTQRILRNWDKGTMTNGKLASGRQTPRLQAYATQIARDAIFKYNGALNEIVRNEFDLNDFIYNGTLLSDSRPLCVHLVRLRRTISLDEMPPLIEKYPDGLYPNTSKKNFLEVTGGYSCRHTATAVKNRKKQPEADKFVPDKLADYEKALSIKVDKKIFSYLKTEVPIRIGKTAYFLPGKRVVNLATSSRYKESKWSGEAVVYHEYGHAIDWDYDLRKSLEVSSLMSKYRQEFKKSGRYAGLDSDSKGQYMVAYRSGDHNLKEQLGAFMDTLMALNRNYGSGHTKVYFKKPEMSEAEFIAHAFENKFIGNEAFRLLAPDLYQDMIDMVEAWLSKLG